MSKFKLSARVPVKPGQPLPFDIQAWLKDPGKLVTRQDLWEFTNRLEVGRRMRNRWPSRLRRWGRRLWGWLTRSPLDVEDKLYR